MAGLKDGDEYTESPTEILDYSCTTGVDGTVKVFQRRTAKLYAPFIAIPDPAHTYILNNTVGIIVAPLKAYTPLSMLLSIPPPGPPGPTYWTITTTTSIVRGAYYTIHTNQQSGTGGGSSSSSTPTGVEDVNVTNSTNPDGSYKSTTVTIGVTTVTTLNSFPGAVYFYQGLIDEFVSITISVFYEAVQSDNSDVTIGPF